MNRQLTLSTIGALALIGCSDRAPKPEPPRGADAIADVAAAANTLPPEHFTSNALKFELELPGVWTAHYSTVERADTTGGAHHAVEFIFRPDSGSKARPLPLMTLRLYTKAAWAAATKRPGSPVGAPIGESPTDVFVLALPASNPYPPSSPEAPAYDRLIISIAQGGQQNVHVTPH